MVYPDVSPPRGFLGGRRIATRVSLHAFSHTGGDRSLPPNSMCHVLLPRERSLSHNLTYCLLLQLSHFWTRAFRRAYADLRFHLTKIFSLM